MLLRSISMPQDKPRIKVKVRWGGGYIGKADKGTGQGICGRRWRKGGRTISKENEKMEGDGEDRVGGGKSIGSLAR